MSAKLICIKPCFFRRRLWAVGETLQPLPNPGEVWPVKCFSERAPTKSVAVQEVAKTLHGLQKEEAQELLAAAGHGGQKVELPGNPRLGTEGSGVAPAEVPVSSGSPVNAEGQAAASPAEKTMFD